MPQRPVDDYWRERIKSLLGADPRREPGPRAIKRLLDAEAERMDRVDMVLLQIMGWSGKVRDHLS
jgi:hypothetical protein